MSMRRLLATADEAIAAPPTAIDRHRAAPPSAGNGWQRGAHGGDAEAQDAHVPLLSTSCIADDNRSDDHSIHRLVTDACRFGTMNSATSIARHDNVSEDSPSRGGPTGSFAPMGSSSSVASSPSPYHTMISRYVAHCIRHGFQGVASIQRLVEDISLTVAHHQQDSLGATLRFPRGGRAGGDPSDRSGPSGMSPRIDSPLFSTSNLASDGGAAFETHLTAALASSPQQLISSNPPPFSNLRDAPRPARRPELTETVKGWTNTTSAMTLAADVAQIALHQASTLLAAAMHPFAQSGKTPPPTWPLLQPPLVIPNPIVADRIVNRADVGVAERTRSPQAALASSLSVSSATPLPGLFSRATASRAASRLVAAAIAMIHLAVAIGGMATVSRAKEIASLIVHVDTLIMDAVTATLFARLIESYCDGLATTQIPSTFSGRRHGDDLASNNLSARRDGWRDVDWATHFVHSLIDRIEFFCHNAVEHGCQSGGAGTVWFAFPTHVLAYVYVASSLGGSSLVRPVLTSGTTAAAEPSLGGSTPPTPSAGAASVGALHTPGVSFPAAFSVGSQHFSANHCRACDVLRSLVHVTRAAADCVASDTNDNKRPTANAKEDGSLLNEPEGGAEAVGDRLTLLVPPLWAMQILTAAADAMGALLLNLAPVASLAAAALSGPGSRSADPSDLPPRRSTMAMGRPGGTPETPSAGGSFAGPSAPQAAQPLLPAVSWWDSFVRDLLVESSGELLYALVTPQLIQQQQPFASTCYDVLFSGPNVDTVTAGRRHAPLGWAMLLNAACMALLHHQPHTNRQWLMTLAAASVAGSVPAEVASAVLLLTDGGGGEKWPAGPATLDEDDGDGRFSMRMGSSTAAPRSQVFLSGGASLSDVDRASSFDPTTTTMDTADAVAQPSSSKHTVAPRAPSLMSFLSDPPMNAPSSMAPPRGGGGHLDATRLPAFQPMPGDGRPSGDGGPVLEWNVVFVVTAAVCCGITEALSTTRKLSPLWSTTTGSSPCNETITTSWLCILRGLVAASLGIIEASSSSSSSCHARRLPSALTATISACTRGATASLLARRDANLTTMGDGVAIDEEEPPSFAEPICVRQQLGALLAELICLEVIPAPCLLPPHAGTAASPGGLSTVVASSKGPAVDAAATLITTPSATDDDEAAAAAGLLPDRPSLMHTSSTDESHSSSLDQSFTDVNAAATLQGGRDHDDIQRKVFPDDRGATSEQCRSPTMVEFLAWVRLDVAHWGGRPTATATGARRRSVASALPSAPPPLRYIGRNTRRHWVRFPAGIRAGLSSAVFAEWLNRCNKVGSFFGGQALSQTRLSGTDGGPPLWPLFEVLCLDPAQTSTITTPSQRRATSWPHVSPMTGPLLDAAPRILLDQPLRREDVHHPPFMFRAEFVETLIGVATSRSGAERLYVAEGHGFTAARLDVFELPFDRPYVDVARNFFSRSATDAVTTHPLRHYGNVAALSASEVPAAARRGGGGFGGGSQQQAVQFFCPHPVRCAEVSALETLDVSTPLVDEDAALAAERLPWFLKLWPSSSSNAGKDAVASVSQFVSTCLPREVTREASRQLSDEMKAFSRLLAVADGPSSRDHDIAVNRLRQLIVVVQLAGGIHVADSLSLLALCTAALQEQLRRSPNGADVCDMTSRGRASSEERGGAAPLRPFSRGYGYSLVARIGAESLRQALTAGMDGGPSSIAVSRLAPLWPLARGFTTAVCQLLQRQPRNVQLVDALRLLNQCWCEQPEAADATAVWNGVVTARGDSSAVGNTSSKHDEVDEGSAKGRTLAAMSARAAGNAADAEDRNDAGGAGDVSAGGGVTFTMQRCACTKAALPLRFLTLNSASVGAGEILYAVAVGGDDRAANDAHCDGGSLTEQASRLATATLCHAAHLNPGGCQRTVLVLARQMLVAADRQKQMQERQRDVVVSVVELSAVGRLCLILRLAPRSMVQPLLGDVVRWLHEYHGDHGANGGGARRRVDGIDDSSAFAECGDTSREAASTSAYPMHLLALYAVIPTLLDPTSVHLERFYRLTEKVLLTASCDARDRHPFVAALAFEALGQTVRSRVPLSGTWCRRLLRAGLDRCRAAGASIDGGSTSSTHAHPASSRGSPATATQQLPALVTTAAMRLVGAIGSRFLRAEDTDSSTDAFFATLPESLRGAPLPTLDFASFSAEGLVLYFAQRITHALEIGAFRDMSIAMDGLVASMPVMVAAAGPASLPKLSTRPSPRPSTPLLLRLTPTAWTQLSIVAVKALQWTAVRLSQGRASEDDNAVVRYCGGVVLYHRHHQLPMFTSKAIAEALSVVTVRHCGRLASGLGCDSVNLSVFVGAWNALKTMGTSTVEEGLLFAVEAVSRLLHKVGGELDSISDDIRRLHAEDDERRHSVVDLHGDGRDRATAAKTTKLLALTPALVQQCRGAMALVDHVFLDDIPRMSDPTATRLLLALTAIASRELLLPNVLSASVPEKLSPSTARPTSPTASTSPSDPPQSDAQLDMLRLRTSALWCLQRGLQLAMRGGRALVVAASGPSVAASLINVVVRTTQSDQPPFRGDGRGGGGLSPFSQSTLRSRRMFNVSAALQFPLPHDVSPEIVNMDCVAFWALRAFAALVPLLPPVRAMCPAALLHLLPLVEAVDVDGRSGGQRHSWSQPPLVEMKSLSGGSRISVAAAIPSQTTTPPRPPPSPSMIPIAGGVIGAAFPPCVVDAASYTHDGVARVLRALEELAYIADDVMSASTSDDMSIAHPVATASSSRIMHSCQVIAALSSVPELSDAARAIADRSPDVSWGILSRALACYLSNMTAQDRSQPYVFNLIHSIYAFLTGSSKAAVGSSPLSSSTATLSPRDDGDRKMSSSSASHCLRLAILDAFYLMHYDARLMQPERSSSSGASSGPTSATGPRWVFARPSPCEALPKFVPCGVAPRMPWISRAVGFGTAASAAAETSQPWAATFLAEVEFREAVRACLPQRKDRVYLTFRDGLLVPLLEPVRDSASNVLPANESVQTLLDRWGRLLAAAALVMTSYAQCGMKDSARTSLASLSEVLADVYESYVEQGVPVSLLAQKADELHRDQRIVTESVNRGGGSPSLPSSSSVASPTATASTRYFGDFRNPADDVFVYQSQGGMMSAAAVLSHHHRQVIGEGKAAAASNFLRLSGPVLQSLGLYELALQSYQSVLAPPALFRGGASSSSCSPPTDLSAPAAMPSTTTLSPGVAPSAGTWRDPHTEATSLRVAAAAYYARNRSQCDRAMIGRIETLMLLGRYDEALSEALAALLAHPPKSSTSATGPHTTTTTGGAPQGLPAASLLLSRSLSSRHLLRTNATPKSVPPPPPGSRGGAVVGVAPPTALLRSRLSFAFPSTPVVVPSYPPTEPPHPATTQAAAGGGGGGLAALARQSTSSVFLSPLGTHAFVLGSPATLADPAHHNRLCELGSLAAFTLGDWGSLHECVNAWKSTAVSQSSSSASGLFSLLGTSAAPFRVFLRAVLAVTQERFDTARKRLLQTWETIMGEADVTAHPSDHYLHQRSHVSMQLGSGHGTPAAPPTSPLPQGASRSSSAMIIGQWSSPHPPMHSAAAVSAFSIPGPPTLSRHHGFALWQHLSELEEVLEYISKPDIQETIQQHWSRRARHIAPLRGASFVHGGGGASAPYVAPAGGPSAAARSPLSTSQGGGAPNGIPAAAFATDDRVEAAAAESIHHMISLSIQSLVLPASRHCGAFVETIDEALQVGDVPLARRLMSTILMEGYGRPWDTDAVAFLTERRADVPLVAVAAALQVSEAASTTSRTVVTSAAACLAKRLMSEIAPYTQRGMEAPSSSRRRQQEGASGSPLRWTGRLDATKCFAKALVQLGRLVSRADFCVDISASDHDQVVTGASSKAAAYIPPGAPLYALPTFVSEGVARESNRRRGLASAIYCAATHTFPAYLPGWHFWGRINFKLARFHLLNQATLLATRFAHAALEGLAQAVAFSDQGGPESDGNAPTSSATTGKVAAEEPGSQFVTSQQMENVLGLCGLIGDFAALPSMREAFLGVLVRVPVSAWRLVVSQIVARLNDPRPAVVDVMQLVVQRLIDHSPHSVVFALIAAAGGNVVANANATTTTTAGASGSRWEGGSEQKASQQPQGSLRPHRDGAVQASLYDHHHPRSYDHRAPVDANAAYPTTERPNAGNSMMSQPFSEFNPGAAAASSCGSGRTPSPGVRAMIQYMSLSPLCREILRDSAEFAASLVYAAHLLPEKWSYGVEEAIVAWKVVRPSFHDHPAAATAATAVSTRPPASHNNESTPPPVTAEEEIQMRRVAGMLQRLLCMAAERPSVHQPMSGAPDAAHSAHHLTPRSPQWRGGTANAIAARNAAAIGDSSSSETDDAGNPPLPEDVIAAAGYFRGDQYALAFLARFKTDILEAKKALGRYFASPTVLLLELALRRFSATSSMKLVADFSTFDLAAVLPSFSAKRGFHVLIPGSTSAIACAAASHYDAPAEAVHMVSSRFDIVSSQRRPRRFHLIDAKGASHTFLLKGREDLRQDERVMQFFRLVNRQLDAEGGKGDGGRSSSGDESARIADFAVVPIALDAGIVEWVERADTLAALIRDYRRAHQTTVATERQLASLFTDAYDNLTSMQKQEVYSTILTHSESSDLARMMLLSSPSVEWYVKGRERYTSSLATMSMVGYVLGLGDRHPMNILVHQDTKHVIHIDFGDCFETAQLRPKLPETVPFRATRMIIAALDVSGVFGAFAERCVRVMHVLRSHRRSLLALLDAFVQDPLLNWKVVELAQREEAALALLQPTRSKPPGFDLPTAGNVAKAAGGATLPPKRSEALNDALADHPFFGKQLAKQQQQLPKSDTTALGRTTVEDPSPTVAAGRAPNRTMPSHPSAFFDDGDDIDVSGTRVNAQDARNAAKAFLESPGGPTGGVATAHTDIGRDDDDGDRNDALAAVAAVPVHITTLLGNRVGSSSSSKMVRITAPAAAANSHSESVLRKQADVGGAPQQCLPQKKKATAVRYHAMAVMSRVEQKLTGMDRSLLDPHRTPKDEWLAARATLPQTTRRSIPSSQKVSTVSNTSPRAALRQVRSSLSNHNPSPSSTTQSTRTPSAQPFASPAPPANRASTEDTTTWSSTSTIDDALDPTTVQGSYYLTRRVGAALLLQRWWRHRLCKVPSLGDAGGGGSGGSSGGLWVFLEAALQAVASAADHHGSNATETAAIPRRGGHGGRIRDQADGERVLRQSTRVMSAREQAVRLIQQATSDDRLSSMFSGWMPMW